MGAVDHARFGSLRVVVLLLLMVGIASAQPQPPIAIHGRVTDAYGKPIRGATVSIEAMPDIAPVTTDKEGRYHLDGVPTGAGVVVIADGYQAGLGSATGAVVDDIVLLTDKQGSETIEVQGEPPPEAPGAEKVSREELQRMPGTSNDLMRTLTAMPGIANVPFPTAYNGVVIRGAAPEDSKFLIDGFEVPALYHDVAFRSIVPIEAIDSLNYIPGGFGVEFGRAASGIVSLTTRPGSDKQTEQFELASLDSSALAQGKSGRWRYMVAFRRSTIDLIIPYVLPKDLDLSLTTFPRYYDAQARVDYALSSKWQLTASMIGSDDALELFTDKTANADKRFYNRTRFARTIVGGKFSDGPWTANIAASVMPLEFVFSSGIYQHIDVKQVALDTRAEAIHSLKEFAGLSDVVWRIGEQTNVSRFDVTLALPPQPREGVAVGGFPDPKDTSNSFEGITWTPDIGLWSALSAGLASDLHATAGVRVDVFGRTGDVAVQPRGELQYKLAPKTTARLSAGAYRRPPENQEELEHTNLHPERATQVIAGVEHEPREGIRLQGSLYYTDRTNLIMRGSDGALSNSGVGTTYGAEALGTVRQGPWFVWVSASLSHSVRHDTPMADERLFEFDQPLSMNAAASYRWKKWQLGGRFQLYSGLPLTPVIGSVFDSDRNFYDPLFGKVYSDRAPAHHQLDLRLDRFWKWGPVQMNWFLDVQNVYLNQSTVAYFYSYDYTQRSAFKSLPILPSVGLRGTL
jgi:outer membrane receptor protein involved in Fe transport